MNVVQTTVLLNTLRLKCHVWIGCTQQYKLAVLFKCLTEVYAGSIVLSNMFIGDRKRAVLETLAYSDVFEFPLRLDEVHRYLSLPATVEQVSVCLEESRRVVESRGGYYFLRGRSETVHLRMAREKRSRVFLPIALKYGRLLGSMPFVRMVALTGSLAVMNVSKEVDFDYMIVAVPGRVWTARAFALLLNRIAKKLGHTLCPNLIVSETSLEWPLHDLYSARELYQMVPITGMDVHQKLIESNSWAKELLPNAVHNYGHEAGAMPFGRLLEFPLLGAPGDFFERWEMTRKIARLSKQEGFGEETIFNADVCQGNFHHHRKWTRQVFEQKIADLDKDVTVTFNVTLA